MIRRPLIPNPGIEEPSLPIWLLCVVEAIVLGIVPVALLVHWLA